MTALMALALRAVMFMLTIPLRQFHW
jgi:hypothetical protein